MANAQIALRSTELTLGETRLRAPVDGTIVSLAATAPGTAESASGGSGTGSSSTGSTAATGSGASGGSGGGTATSGGLSSGTSSSSSGFAQIVNTTQMTMTVAFSESDITKVHVGQPATVTVDALTGVELAAHVSAISPLGSTSNSVVSYDATLTLDQLDPRVRPGMSASASVITGQAQGVNLPNSAVSGSSSLSTVNQLRGGRTVATPVVVGPARRHRGPRSSAA